MITYINQKGSTSCHIFVTSRSGLMWADYCIFHCQTMLLCWQIWLYFFFFFTNPGIWRTTRCFFSIPTWCEHWVSMRQWCSWWWTHWTRHSNKQLLPLTRPTYAGLPSHQTVLIQSQNQRYVFNFFYHRLIQFKFTAPVRIPSKWFLFCFI